MSIASFPLGDAPIAGQLPRSGPKKTTDRAPSNRRIVAKTDPVALPEPR